MTYDVRLVRTPMCIVYSGYCKFSVYVFTNLNEARFCFASPHSKRTQADVSNDAAKAFDGLVHKNTPVLW